MLPTHQGPAEHDRADSSQDESGWRNGYTMLGIVRAEEGPRSIRLVSGDYGNRRNPPRESPLRKSLLFRHGCANSWHVFLGFARSYYLAGAFKAPLPNLIVHIHGAVFSSWILLLIAQTSLVAAGRIDLHRRLGLLGFALACLVVILGLLAATDSLGRHFAPGEPGVGAKAFYAIPIAGMLVFSTLIYFAFRACFNPAAHKRLMLIATITLLDAAFVRWPIPAAWWDLRMAQMCCYPLLLLLIGYDLWSTGKIQRATLWASVFLIVLQQVRSPIGRTVPWQSFATWVQNLARSFH